MIFVLLSKCIANAYSKYRIYTASLQRARGALTKRLSRSRTPPQRCHSVPTARCLTHRANAKPRRIFSMIEINTAA